MIKKFFHAVMACGLIALVMSCEDQKFNNINVDVDKVELDHLTPDMIKVRDYVPEYAVVAHRGSTFWTPEETEAAYRWAREIGADYLECDMQVSKDGVVLALHDDNLKRTTNIENVFGETIPYEIRKAYYQKIGYSEAEAEALVKEDAKNFVPNLPAYYTYEELMMLERGLMKRVSNRLARVLPHNINTFLHWRISWLIPRGKCWNGMRRENECSRWDRRPGKRSRV